MCVDYKGHIWAMLKKSYPLSRTNDILDQFLQANHITKKDLWKEYYHVKLDNESIPLTVFWERYGHFEFMIPPYVLTNAPASFTSTMNNIFREWLKSFASVHLDEILIYRKKFKEHVWHSQQVLPIPRKSFLNAKMSKCTFSSESFKCLGHVVSKNSLDVEG